jgi:hypothetical protein
MSGIFNKYKDQGIENCFIGNEAVAVRADVNTTFIAQQSASYIQNLEYAKCGDPCSTNPCLSGLECGSDLKCKALGSPTCEAFIGSSCSTTSNVICEQQGICSAGQCITLAEASANPSIDVTRIPSPPTSALEAGWRNIARFISVIEISVGGPENLLAYLILLASLIPLYTLYKQIRQY